MRDTKYALSISPFLVLDDNTRICKKDNIFQTIWNFKDDNDVKPNSIAISHTYRELTKEQSSTKFYKHNVLQVTHRT
jgi:hypothetical protein